MSDLLTQLVWVVLLGLAAARVTVLLVEDTILQPLRNKIYLRFPPKDAPNWGFEYQRMDTDGQYLPMGVIRDWSMFGELLSCGRCTSVWVTGALFIAAATSGPLAGTQVELLLEMLSAMWISSWGAANL